MMNETEIDKAILYAVQPYRQKVSMIITKAEKSLLQRPEMSSDEIYTLIAARMVALVESGVLDGYGDLNEWRRSEIKLSGGES